MSQKHCCCPRHTPRLRSGSPTQPGQNPRRERCGRGAPQSFRHPARTGWQRSGRGMELAAGTLWTWSFLANLCATALAGEAPPAQHSVAAHPGLHRLAVGLASPAVLRLPLRADSFLFMLPPDPTAEYACDAAVATCLGTLVPPRRSTASRRSTGFATCRPRSAAADHCAAYGASWRDTLPQSVLVPHRSPRTSCTRSLHLIVMPAAPLRVAAAAQTR